MPSSGRPPTPGASLPARGVFNAILIGHPAKKPGRGSRSKSRSRSNCGSMPASSLAIPKPSTCSTYRTSADRRPSKRAMSASDLVALACVRARSTVAASSWPKSSRKNCLSSTLERSSGRHSGSRASSLRGRRTLSRQCSAEEPYRAYRRCPSAKVMPFGPSIDAASSSWKPSSSQKQTGHRSYAPGPS